MNIERRAACRAGCWRRVREHRLDHAEQPRGSGQKKRQPSWKQNAHRRISSRCAPSLFGRKMKLQGRSRKRAREILLARFKGQTQEQAVAVWERAEMEDVRDGAGVRKKKEKKLERRRDTRRKMPVAVTDKIDNRFDFASQPPPAVVSDPLLPVPPTLKAAERWVKQPMAGIQFDHSNVLAVVTSVRFADVTTLPSKMAAASLRAQWGESEDGHALPMLCMIGVANAGVLFSE
ncbi:hypothetical protein MRX96_044246 [Rhipicephalus microplus]